MVVAITFLLNSRYSWEPVEAWLITVNVVAAMFFGYDKLLALNNRKRIPEKVLFGLVLVGGSLGGLVSMTIFRHKVKKTSFQRVFWMIVVVQVVIVGIWYIVIR